MILSLSLSISSHPLLCLLIASCARARATHVSAAFIFSTYFYTRLLRHGSQRVGVAPSRIVPLPPSLPSPSFSLSKSRTTPRDVTCNLRANLSLFVTSAARYFISSFSHPFAQAGSTYKAPQNWRKMDIYVHFPPHRKHRDSNNELSELLDSVSSYLRCILSEKSEA